MIARLYDFRCYSLAFTQKLHRKEGGGGWRGPTEIFDLHGEAFPYTLSTGLL